MKVLVTADIHFNHPRARALAVEQIAQINAMQFDVLLVVGDTATADGQALEECLCCFTFTGPKLFVAGNHELWTRQAGSRELMSRVLPQRVTAAGWHWLEGHPLRLGSVAFVGTIGWYDYSFAADQLEIPRRFYEAKVSPGAAARLEEYAYLLAGASDVEQRHLEIVARWNDGRYVKLESSDEQFMEERLAELRRSLAQVNGAARVIAAVHHVPHRDLLPPRRGGSWDFAWAYLGSGRIGQTLMEHGRATHIVCGHSHFPQECEVDGVRLINVGSGYRQKRSVMLEVE